MVDLTSEAVGCWCKLGVKNWLLFVGETPLKGRGITVG